jgi:hypothetical protein
LAFFPFVVFVVFLTFFTGFLTGFLFFPPDNEGGAGVPEQPQDIAINLYYIMTKKFESYIRFNYKIYRIMGNEKYCVTCTTRRARFNLIGQEAKYCHICCTPEMIIVKGPSCVKCLRIQPMFNLEGETVALFCQTCKTNQMVNVLSPKCIVCKKITPLFNYANETKALYCAGCKLEHMIDVKNKRCIKCNLIRPNYNYANETKPLYCAGCKLEHMVDIVSKKCVTCESKQPNYNYENETTPLYCQSCKLPNMININAPKCIKCLVKYPCFNVIGEKPMYCFQCKEIGMIDVLHPRCIGCSIKIPSFNLPGETKALFCQDCKTSPMINIVGPKCVICNKVAPSFNYKEESVARYCSNCKDPKMVNVVSPKCIVCNILAPSFNTEGETKPAFCYNCKEDHMIDVVHSRCITPLCGTIVTNKEKYRGHCSFCFINLYPNEPIVRHYRTKERHINDFIKENFLQQKVLYDKQIVGGCSKKRPDIFIECLTHSIIVEIDENQHDIYDTTCENKRAMELFQDLGNRPVVFIRFNPDKYTINNKIIPSCFEAHKKNGVLYVKNKEDWDKRLSSLKSKIEYHIENIPTKEVTIDKLYYDE